MVLDIFGEPVVGFFLLHLQHACHFAVGRAQLYLPMNQTFVNILPALIASAVGNLHGELLIFLLVAALCNLCNNLLAVYVLLQCQQNLTRINGLYQVVGNLRAYGLVHNVFLFALGNHDDRRLGLNVFHLLEGFKPR